MRELVSRLIAEAQLIADEDVGRNKEMSRLGAEWLIEELERRGSPKLDEDGKVNVYATVTISLLLDDLGMNNFSSFFLLNFSPGQL